VTITVEYPGEEGPAQAALPPLPLEAYTTKDIPLDSVLGSLPLPLPFCSIRIQYSGAPGSAIGEVSSVESKGDLVIDSRLANEADGWAGSGAHPWHLDDRTESVLFLTNMADKDCPIGVHIQAEGSHYYLTDVRLKPHETRAIDLRQLRNAEGTDFLGNKIPAAASDGSVLWIRLRKVPVMGRLVVMQRHKGMASNYDCNTGCCCPPNSAGVQVSPSTNDMLPEDTQQFNSFARRRDCNASMTYETVTDSSAWMSSNPPVASLDATTKGLVHGVSAGSAHIEASFTDLIYSPPCGECTETEITPQGTGTNRVRLAKWAVVYSDTGAVDDALCVPVLPGSKMRTRYFEAWDDIGLIPNLEYWILKETGQACGGGTGGEDFRVTFDDVNSNCHTDCTVQLHQRFFIGRTKPQALLRQVKVKNCRTCPEHDGWLVTAPYNNVTITDE